MNEKNINYDALFEETGGEISKERLREMLEPKPENLTPEEMLARAHKGYRQEENNRFQSTLVREKTKRKKPKK